ncbi:galactosylgalactosylxylosylprotein 3-beta-glucuronosyltransferase 2-like [Symsagittifera roscoffensis]|uniref:galactosylgalactosylxylosylprotein 3-beta-glucuronosyltransferase 2-like n=1 Tax=Symsagittifera roscoffensis TaxID=84072 RepID=UPI00307B99A1
MFPLSNRASHFLLLLFITLTAILVLLYLQTNLLDKLERPTRVSSSYGELRSVQKSFNSFKRPRLIVVTPTYGRATQIADLVRLKQTLSLLKDCDWIVVEDAIVINREVQEYIGDYKAGKLVYLASHSRDRMFRGMQQRNLALQLIRSHYQQSFFSSRNTRAVVYFADDDNSYDAVFLDSLRFTNSISLFNVGLILDRRYEGPILENNKIVGFNTMFYGGRRFCIDMAGFAISLRLLLQFPSVSFVAKKQGTMESEFLESFGVPLSEMEFFSGRRGIHVWHTQTKPVGPKDPDLKVYPENNTVIDTRSQEEIDQVEKWQQQKQREEEKRNREIFRNQLKRLNERQRQNVMKYLRMKSKF